MWIFLGVILLVILILCLPIRFSVEYGENGFSVLTKIAFFKLPEKFQLDSSKKTDEKPKKKTKEAKTPGKLSDLNSIVKPVFEALGKLVRSFCVRKLILHVKIATADAFSTAMLYGGVAAIIGFLFPFVDKNIKIKKKQINVLADFEGRETSVYLKADISILIIQCLYVLLVLLPILSVKDNSKKEGK